VIYWEFIFTINNCYVRNDEQIYTD